MQKKNKKWMRLIMFQIIFCLFSTNMSYINLCLTSKVYHSGAPSTISLEWGVAKDLRLVFSENWGKARLGWRALKIMSTWYDFWLIKLIIRN